MAILYLDVNGLQEPPIIIFFLFALKAILAQLYSGMSRITVGAIKELGKNLRGAGFAS